jgi:hypothetical protein
VSSQHQLGPGTPDCPVVHRTVSGAPGWPTVNRLLSGNYRGVRLKFTGLSGGAPDSVRCANQPRGATVGCAQYGRRSRTGHEQWLSGGAPDSPVHHSTEGKISLPSWLPTAPSCLGAIKGTPRRMEQTTKLSRNILRLPDSVSTHLIRCVSDLSFV